jgi:hypothetical protein
MGQTHECHNNNPSSSSGASIVILCQYWQPSLAVSHLAPWATALHQLHVEGALKASSCSIHLLHRPLEIDNKQQLTSPSMHPHCIDRGLRRERRFEEEIGQVMVGHANQKVNVTTLQCEL